MNFAIFGIVSYTRIFDIIEHQQQTFPLDVCLARRERHTEKTGQEKEWIGYSTSDVTSTAHKVAKGLLKLGLKKGDKIAIISVSNRPEWHFIDLAALQIGVVDIPIYPTISSKEYEYIFNHAEIKYVFVSDTLMYRKIAQVIPRIPSIEGVFSFDAVENVQSWKSLVSEDTTLDQHLNNIKASISPNDLATIIYTSGTTGIPKGVMLSHHNIVSNVKDCLKMIPVHPKEVVLSFLPLCHVFERTINYVYFAGSCSIYYADGLETISEHLTDIRPHYFTTVPRLLERVFEKIVKKGRLLDGLKRKLFFWALYQAEHTTLGEPKTLIQSFELSIANKLIFSKWREALGGRIKAIICGSAPLQPKLATIFTNAGLPVLEGYGLTECSPVVSVVPYKKEDYRAGSVGKLLPSVEAKIGEDGEILIKGPSVMMGYYKDEEETQRVFDKEGWLLTGDIGEFSQDGFLKITDRKKELFKTSGGKYVAPAPIENKLKESFFIEQVALVGDGEKYISALIVPNFENLKEWAKEQHVSCISNSELIEDNHIKDLYKELITEFNVNFGKVEQIKQFQLLSEEWTAENGLLTATLKLRRKALKEKYKDLIDSLYNKSYKYGS